MGVTMPRFILLTLLLIGCGSGDATGPSGKTFAGTYQGQAYIISTSTVPVERDSASAGAVTLTLASKGGDTYDLSTTYQTNGFAGSVTVNAAGVIGFPNFDESGVISSLSSTLLGICNLSNASASPGGTVTGDKLTYGVTVSGLICDYGAGTGVADLRPTVVQITLTGTR